MRFHDISVERVRKIKATALERFIGQCELQVRLRPLRCRHLEPLGPAEAAALSGMIERWWHRPILQLEADRLWLLGASDDLALESSVSEVLRLSSES